MECEWVEGLVIIDYERWGQLLLQFPKYVGISICCSAIPFVKTYALRYVVVACLQL